MSWFAEQSLLVAWQRLILIDSVSRQWTNTDPLLFQHRYTPTKNKIMAEPRTVEDVFAKIRKTLFDSPIRKEGSRKRGEFVHKLFEHAQQTYPFMSNVTILDYYRYSLRQNALQKQMIQGPKPTPEQFWNAAYNFDPLNTPAGTVSDLQRILSRRNLESVPLGKYGAMSDARLELLPEIGALPTTDDVEGRISLRYAATDSGAISYPDGHPSEFEESRVRIKSTEDRKLRRFASLGWVIRVDGNSWARTGHVLVMDMDVGRNRHPWFVLASEWPAEFEDADGGFTTYAEARVDRDDSSQPGVLPNGKNRTPVARIIPYHKTPDTLSIPVLKQFGPNFDFIAERFGGDRSYDGTKVQFGPDLAHVMEWYWDPVTEEEVCFYKNGKEYMRYDRRNKQYTYPNMEDLQRSIVGEMCLFGVVSPPTASPSGSRFVSLGERMGPPAQAPRQRQAPRISTATDF